MRLNDPWLLLRAWVLAPALVMLASAGLGLLVARLAGMRLRALTLPVGFLAGIAIVTFVLQVRLATGSPAAIGLALLAAAGLAAAVAGMRRDGRPLRPPPSACLWAAGAGAVAFAAFMAPLVGTGRSGIVGYVLNNDPAVHLASVELIRDHGPVGFRSLSDSYHYVSGNFGSGYPIGSYVWPLFGRVFTGTDPFHLWTPMIALTAGMLALVGFAVLRQLAAPAPLAAAGGLLPACGYLTYSYAAQGGAKEVAASLGVYASVAAFAAARERSYDWRGLLPAVLCVAGGLAVFGLAELAWLGPAGLVALVAVLAARRRSDGLLRATRDLALAAGLFLALALPALVAGRRFVTASSEEVLNDVGETGNLLAPLRWIEAFGVWLTKDYRFPTTDDDTLTGIGIGLAIALGLVGIALSIRRRQLAVPLAVFAGFAGVGLVVLRGRHGIYLDAKAYALLAPGLGLAAAAGIVELVRARRLAVRAIGSIAGIGLAIGVVASDSLVYAGAWSTPKSRFAEMIDLDTRYAGQGPTLINEREEYAKHLFRHVKPWMAWDSYIPSRGFTWGETPPAVPHVPDFDDHRADHFERFPLLIERKRPAGSRPPGNYEIVEETAHYRVWRRAGPAPRTHLALGNGDTLEGTSRLDCRAPEFRAVLQLARRTGEPLRVAWGQPIVVRYDHQWRTSGPVLPGPQPNFNFRLDDASDIPTRLELGRWEAWIQGSFGPGQRLSLHPPGAERDDRPAKIGEVRSDLGIHDGFQRFGEVKLTRPRQVFQLLSLDRPWWLAGSRRPNLVGPVVFTPADDLRRVEEVSPAAADRLCGRHLDWLEIP